MALGVHSMQHFSEQLAIAAGIVLGLGVLGRAFWGGWRFLRKAVQIVDWIEEIYIEFQPNHGTSVKDVIERIDANVKVNSRNIDTLYGTVLKMHELDPNDAALLEPLEPSPKDKRA